MLQSEHVPLGRSLPKAVHIKVQWSSRYILEALSQPFHRFWVEFFCSILGCNSLCNFGDKKYKLMSTQQEFQRKSVKKILFLLILIVSERKVLRGLLNFVSFTLNLT